MQWFIVNTVSGEAVDGPYATVEAAALLWEHHWQEQPGTFALVPRG